MKIVNIHEAKTHLSRLVDEAAAGTEVVIAKAGRPIAKLVPIRPAIRKLGTLRGRIRIADDFDDPLPPEVQEQFDQ